VRTKPWACPWWDQALAPSRGGHSYTNGSGAQDGVNFWHRRRRARATDRGRRRFRTWTHSSTEGSAESAHAVEFSKTVAPLQEGVPSQRYARQPVWLPGRIDEYSAAWPARRGAAGARADLRHYLHGHSARAGAVVEVDQYHLLPGPEGQPAVDDRDRLR